MAIDGEADLFHNVLNKLMDNIAYHRSFERLQHIMRELRDKCPWDKKQTIQSLRPQSIEELYELTDAITDENWQELKKSSEIYCCILSFIQG